eukprot:313247-Pelagomonas_calceolata.AAC.11
MNPVSSNPFQCKGFASSTSECLCAFGVLCRLNASVSRKVCALEGLYAFGVLCLLNASVSRKVCALESLCALEGSPLKASVPLKVITFEGRCAFEGFYL